MPGPTSKSSAIPSWQQQATTAPADQSSSLSPSPSSDDAPAPAPTSRQELLDQASRFLEDESIRDSPTDRKVSFLESKGLNQEEIQQLLGLSRNPEATSNSSGTTEDKGEETTPTPSSSSHHEATSPSTATESSTTTAMAQARPPVTPSTPSTTSRDVPPIITYPEFLLQASKPPPLVTMRGTLYTIYGAAGLGAGIYGASEYLVKPMLANLTTARHELAATAKENLQKLNEKLEQNVSVVPTHLTADKANTEEGAEEFDDDSITSDPTELFHRDIGTQTAPVSRPPSSSATREALESTVDDPSIAVSNHVNRIESIQSQLKEVTDFERDSSNLEDSMRARLTDLHHYLDGMIYSTPSYTAVGPAYSLYGGHTGSGLDGRSTGVRKSEDEAIAGFKAEIRGVKGALLSARNFPASRAGRLGGLPAAGR
ncbi:uncharacterized protein N7459_001104 [Penicillium hispanicum]|uniref:uncharacterized protein n=1 Tax=Penicillium hispanicum TaxID=1080232 RepID=UPI0025420DA1|nr:uncharacterized protein N7459_001104 [Penicillium hispanicum]KAJ5594896.1 hypothetical protein N7459_001104 [Penicillium hispanicum]